MRLDVKSGIPVRFEVAVTDLEVTVIETERILSKRKMLIFGEA